MFAQGFDVSWWQGAVDWKKAVDAGIKFAFIRAGSCDSATGAMYSDHAFPTHIIDAPKELDLLGYYWYFRPNHDPIAQADYFVDLIDFAPLVLPPVADLEDAGGLGPSALEQSCKKFLDRIESKMHVKPIIYTRASWWNYYMRSPSWGPDYDLWIARYSASLSHPWGDGAYKPTSWADWKFWQYSADGNYQGPVYGVDSDHIDLNRWNGDLNSLRDYAGLVILPEDPDIASLLARVEQLESRALGLETWAKSFEE